MHIALCDDNVADRKQFERLMKRESDRRADKDGIIFVDSFGNAGNLLSNPMQYDAFYIDVCKTPGTDGITIANQLLRKGVRKPIVMCSSAINYRDYSFPENVIFLDKPVKVAELSESVDLALKIKAAAAPQIEFRIEEKTIYLTEPEILYAVEEGRMLHVTLKDNSSFNVLDSALNFFSQVESWPVFFMPTNKAVINGRYISKVGFRKVIMSDGRPFHVIRTLMPFARKVYQKYQGKDVKENL